MIRQRRRWAGDQDRCRMTADGSPTRTLLIADPHHPDRLAGHVNRPWLRLLARLLASRLDRRLASGLPPESGVLVAARAERLVSPLHRWTLAQNWEALLAQVHRPPAMREPRVQVCRARIMAAEVEVRAMLRALVTPLPVSARGVALVNRLLCDGAGPLYNRHSMTDLDSLVREATTLLLSLIHI